MHEASLVIEVPTSRVARFHSQSEPVARTSQFRLYSFAPRPLRQKPNNDQGLSQDYKNDSINISLVFLPQAGLLINQGAASCLDIFLKSPRLKSRPIKNVGVGSTDARDVLWLLAIENPDGHPTSYSTLGCKTRYVAISSRFVGPRCSAQLEEETYKEQSHGYLGQVPAFAYRSRRQGREVSFDSLMLGRVRRGWRRRGDHNCTK